MATSGNVSTAAVFVHGFAGNARTTWNEFEYLVRSDPQWLDCDVFFLGYASVRDEMTLTAGYVSQFLQDILPIPPARLLKLPMLGRTHVLRTNPGQYQRLLLVGHSEGGVVLRSVVLGSVKQWIACGSATVANSPASLGQICNSEVRLFAPAVSGARIAGRLGILANLFGLRSVIDAIRGYSPAMQDLESRSQLLQRLESDTTYFAEQYPSLGGLRARIAWAHRDDVVTSMGYRHDIECRIRNTTHTSVCKPNSTYLEPVELVLNGAISNPKVLI